MRIAFIIASIFLIQSCNNDDCEMNTDPRVADQMEVDIFKMRVTDDGGGGGLSCGLMVIGAIDSTFTVKQYKAIQIPEEMLRNRGLFYKAKINIYSDTYKCFDQLSDPPQEINANYIEILDWELDD